MGKDYYQILGVPKDADESTIKKAYKRLAIRWHPDKQTGTNTNKEEAQKKFIEISEAYEVLSDKEKRSIYDQYGEDGLKNGQNGQPAFHFSAQDANNMFRMFMGDLRGSMFRGTPLDVAFQSSSLGEGISMVFGPDIFMQRKDKPVIRPLSLTLEQLYEGTSKRLRITRMEYDEKTKELNKVPHDIEISVQPGWYDGTQINYERMGDRYPGRIPADVIFVVKQLPHPLFERDNNDLYHKITLSLRDALCGCVLKIPTLKKTEPFIEVDCRKDIIEPRFQKVIKGYGMPITPPNNKQSSPKRFGNLIIEFNVVFPRSLSSHQKEKLREFLPPLSKD